mmetsp:Transcript_22310/g.34519  ORF Transcript_22310/g.34519 Transcript_22310/m.34519 type:complete len:116 (-) Transcript_22310:2338-2685(-)
MKRKRRTTKTQTEESLWNDAPEKLKYTYFEYEGSQMGEAELAERDEVSKAFFGSGKDYSASLETARAERRDKKMNLVLKLKGISLKEDDAPQSADFSGHKPYTGLTSKETSRPSS